MDDPRWEPGMPVLDRQVVADSPTGASAAPGASAVPSPSQRGGSVVPGARSVVPRAVPETVPTPLQAHYVNLSAIALVAGAVAITALETGSSLGSPLVKVGVLVAAPILIATTTDASVRIWRSAWAWLPVDRGRGLFRFAWLFAAGIGIAVFALAAVVVLLA